MKEFLNNLSLPCLPAGRRAKRGNPVSSLDCLVVLLLAMTFLCAACSFRVERDYQTLVYHLPADPTTLNPMTNTDGYSGAVTNFIYDALIERDNETLEFKPMLAKKWDISPDHLQYTFYIRDDVYWHDGAKFTADDVIYSFERIKDPKVDAAPLRVYYKDVRTAEKLDDHTVRFTYAFPYFLAFEVLGSMPIVPKHILDDGTDLNQHPYGRHPIGTGPYKFKEWKTGTKIVLEKNDDYWGKKSEIESLEFKIVTDPSVALQVMKKGEIDLSSLSEVQWIKQANTKNFDDRFNKYKYFLPGYSFIAWNEDRPFFKDARVRRAMTMLLDREKIREKVLFGLAETVIYDAYKFGPIYDGSIAPYPYDPEGAVKLLEEVGWSDHDGDGIIDKDGIPFRFTFMSSGTPFSEKISNILRENLKKVGIDMEISKFEWSVFSKNLSDRAFDATSLMWGGGGIEGDPYQLWHSSQVDRGSNFVGFNNKEADDIIVNTRKEFDPNLRHEMFRRFQRILYDEQPYTFLFANPSLIAVQKRFTDVKVYKLGIDIREWGVTRPQMQLYQ